MKQDNLSIEAVNIIDTVYCPTAPKSAQFAVLTTDKKAIQMFYRIVDVKYNDGSVSPRLEYLSTCGGGWMGTNERKPLAFIQTHEFVSITKQSN